MSQRNDRRLCALAFLILARSAGHSWHGAASIVEAVLNGSFAQWRQARTDPLSDNPVYQELSGSIQPTMLRWATEWLVNGSHFAAKLNDVVATGKGKVTEQSLPVIGTLCREFIATQPHSEVESLRLSRDARSALLYYSARCSIEAVQGPLPERVADGLTALVIENGALDIRDTIRVMAQLFHSASTLQLDTVGLFTRFADMATSDKLASSIRRFSVPAGSPSVGLEQFGLRASGAGERFKYADDVDLFGVVRMYLKAPGLTFAQRLMFLRMVRRQNPEKWHALRRSASRGNLR